MGLHHPRSRPTKATNWPSKSRLSLNQWPCRNTSSRRTTHPRSRNSIRSRSSLQAGLVWRRWALNGHGDDLFAAEEDEAKRSAVFALFLGSLRRRKLPELFTVAENEIHVAVKGHELADQLTAILDRDSHPIIDVL